MTDAVHQRPALLSAENVHQPRCRWSVQPHREISAAARVDGAVEIEEKSEIGRDEDEHIFVSAPNAVRLGRSILRAAGLISVLIAAEMRGELVLIDDGTEPPMSGDNHGA
jgi:hypothetical protein